MKDIKIIVGKNLAELRKRKKYTQLDLANILQYSDKAISKWEKGDSLPDIEILYQICNLYGVTLDYLTHEGSYEEKKDYVIHNTYRRNKILITGLFEVLVWFIAVLIYVFNLIYAKVNYWPVFVWATPISSVVLLVFNTIWGRKKWKFIIFSLITWTILTAFFIQFIYLNVNLWPVFILGIPVQVAILLWASIKK